MTERGCEAAALLGRNNSMLPIRQRNVIRQRVHFRIRQKMQGTLERPRLNVYRSLNHIYAQIIDDAKGETLLSASSLAAKVKSGGNVAAAKEVGKLVAERALEKGIKKVVFDRGGYLYHGRIKALADAAREAGLEF
jgi:large subunit ribosomal protein L18